MEIDSGKSYDSSKWEMHLSHGALLCLSIVFSWVLWCIVDLPVFNKMNGWPLFWEILKNFGEQIIETTILLELSLVYIRFIVKIFWNKEKNLKNHNTARKKKYYSKNMMKMKAFQKGIHQIIC